jgi:hypothetical protein
MSDSTLRKLAGLASLENPLNVSQGTVEVRATERLLVTRQAYQVAETGKRVSPGQKRIGRP